MVPAAHANDLGGSIRYPASCCGAVRVEADAGPCAARTARTATRSAPWPSSTPLTRTVRDSAAILDVISGSELGEPFPAPPVARPFLDEVGATPGRLRIAWSTPSPPTGIDRPRLRRGARGRGRACASSSATSSKSAGSAESPQRSATPSARLRRRGGLDHRVLDPQARPGARRRRNRTADPGVLGTRQRRCGADYLMGLERLRAYSRQVAQFFEQYDLWLTPALAQPPPTIGEMLGTDADPFAGLRRSSQFVAFPGIVANITGNPAMSVPLHWNAAGLPIGVHFLGPLRRRSDPVPTRRTARSSASVGGPAPSDLRVERCFARLGNNVKAISLLAIGGRARRGRPALRVRALRARFVR